MTYKLVGFDDVITFPQNFPEGGNGNRAGTGRVMDTITQVVGGYVDRQPSHWPPRFQKRQIVYEDNLLASSAMTSAWEAMSLHVGRAGWLYREDDFAVGHRIWARLVELSELPRGMGKLQPIRFVFETFSPNWSKAYPEVSAVTEIIQATYSTDGQRTVSGEIFGTGHIYDAEFLFEATNVSPADIDIRVTISVGVNLPYSSFRIYSPTLTSTTSDIKIFVQNSGVRIERLPPGDLVPLTTWDGWPHFSFLSTHNHPHLILIPPNSQPEVSVIDNTGGGFRSFKLSLRQAYN